MHGYFRRWGIFPVLLFSLLSGATTVEQLSLKDLTEASNAVILGRCTATEAVWLDKKIYTVATVFIEDSAKGSLSAGAYAKVYFLGGTVKKPVPIKMQAPGTPTIAVGEEAVLFLEERAADDSQSSDKTIYGVAGMMQGKLSVRTDPATGVKTVRADFGNKRTPVSTPHSPDGVKARSVSSEPAQTEEAAQFLARVRTLAAAGRDDAKARAEEREAETAP